MIEIISPYKLLRNKELRGLEAPTTILKETLSDDQLMRLRVFWLLIIRQAMFDYVKWKSSPRVDNRRDAEDARKWLFEDSLLSNSLTVACQIVGVNVEYIRDRAKRLTIKDVKKMEFQDRDSKIDLLLPEPDADCW